MKYSGYRYGVEIVSTDDYGRSYSVQYTDSRCLIFNIRIFHEAIKRLLGRSRDKRYKEGIINFVKDIKEFVKMYIWIPRCDAINKWENSMELQKKMKRMGKSNCTRNFELWIM
ncbi:hypothetical protein RhiirA1_464147 [Rhizophagus irregularis]|uniref:Uncharacterized protein n=1 Tax=Rhizophagus irregularis TaxID=588596 RepID=A0A2N0RIM5_9GLOM|nr:hypothetical protein RhiirA1_464147 [Rhizophagus irregularis]CAB5179853.1 unnamed protein product [Rhizophagus irregularis]